MLTALSYYVMSFNYPYPYTNGTTWLAARILERISFPRYIHSQANNKENPVPFPAILQSFRRSIASLRHLSPCSKDWNGLSNLKFEGRTSPTRLLVPITSAQQASSPHHPTLPSLHIIFSFDKSICKQAEHVFQWHWIKQSLSKRIWSPLQGDMGFLQCSALTVQTTWDIKPPPACPFI